MFNSGKKQEVFTYREFGIFVQDHEEPCFTGQKMKAYVKVFAHIENETQDGESFSLSLIRLCKRICLI